ncbi:MAG: hypothetical protein JO101_06795 [Candidatus Eremiobacteraeota bacterium]|nr:hypothetical protein [Candidatus Eremiobacteraeota bacterium]MBV8355010.1 hypothetical protein [Candidatus Eremiobacteraeota bacterium]
MGVQACELKRLPLDATIPPLAQRASYGVACEVAGVVAEARFDDSEAAALYRRRYRHVLTDRPARMFTYAVARRPNEVYFWGSGESAYCWDHCNIGPNRISFFADALTTTEVFTSVDGVVALHGAAVSDGSGVAAILGSSNSGKTTTAVACARRGLTVYSDEFCVISDGEVVPFPRAINLRGGGLALLAADARSRSPIDRWLRAQSGGDANDVGFDELFGSLPASAERKPLRVVFSVAGTADDARAKPISAAQMIGHAKPWAKMKPRGLEAVHGLLAMLHDVACYELWLGTPDRTARLVAQMLEGVTP